MSRASSVSSQSTSSTTPGNSQFKHTFLWNNIIQHLKKSLLANGRSSSDDTNSQGVTYTHRLRKQHSRFVTGGMLLIKQNLLSSTGLTPNSNNLDNICFTGAQCVDIIYCYLTSKDQIGNFERQVTREKVTKLCQSIMDSGVFEPVSRSSTKFDDTLLKFYRFKPEDKPLGSKSGHSENIMKNKQGSKDDLSTLSSEKDKKTSLLFANKNSTEDTENNGFNRNIVGMAFNKCKMMNKTSMSNTKLKRKVTSMKRSSTIQTLMPVEQIPANTGRLESAIRSPSTSSNRNENTNKLDMNSVDISNSPVSKSKIDSKISSKLTVAQDMLLMRQITRELVVEKLLLLIDLPVVEQLLVIDECNDIDYRELIDRIDSKLYFNSTSQNVCVDENQNILASQGTKFRSGQKKNSNESQSYASRILAILNEAHDLANCDTGIEWKKSALECLEFIDPSKLNQIPSIIASKESSIGTTILAAKTSLTNAFNQTTINSDQNKSSQSNSKQFQLYKMKDLELYNAIVDYYAQKRNCFLDDSFQPLFTHILRFLRNSQYMKALETLNLGTLLLLKQTQAELKRLLKFLYLTANFTSAPRLAENKQNNSVLLNNFAGCLFDTKLLTFEESRLILNFMLNNFDHLFKLTKAMEESVNKRRLMIEKYGQEEALLEKLYCKKLTNKEYVERTKDQTTKALVDLINHIVDDPQISLKQKKLKLKALQRIHPEIYDQYFADLF